MADAPTEPTFGGNAGGESVWVVDTNAGQVMGGITQGIGLTGVDGADLEGWRIGADAVTDEIIVDTDGDLATPI